jgi:hypothetical protein
MSLKTALSLFIFLFTTSLVAQKKSTAFQAQKWGDILDADLSMRFYPLDSSAAAVVLQDVGKLELYFRKRKVVVELNRHRRVKVFDVEAFNQGNLRIFYRANKAEEKMADLDIQVITPSGQVEKVKSDNVFTETISDKWLAKKIFIPNLQKGSIIEYRYVLRSADYFNLYEWYFQEDIPIRWSELTIKGPDYMNYIHLLRGPKQFDVEETLDKEEVWIEGNKTYNSITRYGLSNMQAFKVEPYMTAPEDYRARILFQLRSINLPFLLDGDVITKWNDLIANLAVHPAFGRMYRDSIASLHIWQTFKPSILPTDSTEQIAEKALRFISEQVKWDETYNLFSFEMPDEVFKNKTGSSAQLNLSLVSLLRRAGLDAIPVLVSTRSNGLVVTEFPVLKQFNSVLAFVRKDSSGGILLDATSKFHALNELNSEHYNRQGRLVDYKGPHWIPLVSPDLSETWYGVLSLDEAGDLSGNFTISAGGLLSTAWRALLEQNKESEFLKKAFGEHLPDVKYDSIAFSKLKDYGKPISVHFNCRISGAANVINDYIYCKPVLDFIFLENPFKSPTRNFPVNFPCPLKGNYVLTLNLPKGYRVEELPADVKITLPENAGKLAFTCSKSGDSQIQVVLKAQINKLDFAPEEYSGLRRFFELATEKLQTQLVLVKS